MMSMDPATMETKCRACDGSGDEADGGPCWACAGEGVCVHDPSDTREASAASDAECLAADWNSGR